MDRVSEAVPNRTETIGPLDALKTLARLSSRKTITLVYSAADEEHNQAVVLKELLEELA
jgi:uncharacterized protein YeaO (DUF488 family)